MAKRCVESWLIRKYDEGRGVIREKGKLFDDSLRANYSHHTTLNWPVSWALQQRTVSYVRSAT